MVCCSSLNSYKKSSRTSKIRVNFSRFCLQSTEHTKNYSSLFDLYKIAKFAIFSWYMTKTKYLNVLLFARIQKSSHDSAHSGRFFVGSYLTFLSTVIDYSSRNLQGDTLQGEFSDYPKNEVGTYRGNLKNMRLKSVSVKIINF